MDQIEIFEQLSKTIVKQPEVSKIREENQAVFTIYLINNLIFVLGRLLFILVSKGIITQEELKEVL